VIDGDFENLTNKIFVLIAKELADKRTLSALTYIIIYCCQPEILSVKKI
jgi:hypothetical protein